MFWICDQKSVDNTPRFYLLLNSLYTVSRPVSHAALPVSRLGVPKKLGGDTAGAAVLNWPEGYPRPYDVILSHKSWGKKKGDIRS